MRKEDFEISKMSYTSKDFASIYPEVLQIAESLTNKWTPTQSNESDPGVVLLKEGAFLTDHLNYNIDKNILENFLPSATQDRSVRDICEMNGYTPRYYVSATGEVKVRYKNTTGEGMPTDANGVGVVIPKFTLVIATDDESISYTQVTDLTLSGSSNKDLVGTTLFMQGTLQTLSINNTSVITLSNLNDNNRLYFPEYMIAQNGIFITSVDDNNYEWERDNYLLTKPSGSKVYKVDYDSYNGLPYIEFPSDIASLIGNGLYIRYISTLGEAGNVDANSLVKIISPTEYIDYTRPDDDHTWSMENVTCANSYSILNGKNPETINQMYNSFMKTVGTFDTLVTCLDYSNYVYNIEDDFGKNIVSNAYVTDRRTDYNKALNVISYDLNGEYFDNISLKSSSIKYRGCGIDLPENGIPGDLFFLITTGINKIEGRLYLYDVTGWKDASTISINSFTNLTTSMTPYDLSIYALKVFSLMDYNPYIPQQALEESFKPVDENTLDEIKAYIEDGKNICHTYKDPELNDIFTFKNYAPLRVSIIPYNKVTKAERNEILNNIYIAISNNFNARNVEFGEELVRDELKRVIIGADSRIKDITLDFDYYMKAMTGSGLEYGLDSMDIFSDSTILVDLIAKNVLAGRVCLFDFEDRFIFEYGQYGGTFYEDISRIKTESIIPVDSEGWTQTQGLEYVVSTKINSHADAKYAYRYILNAASAADGEARAIWNLQEGDSFILQELDRESGKTLRSNTYTTASDIAYNLSVDSGTITNSLSNIAYNLQNCILTLSKVTKYASTTSGKINLNEYKVKENETIQIIYPNYYSTSTYGTYVLYRYHDDGMTSADTIHANQEHVLKYPIYLKYTQDGVTKTDTLAVGTTIKADFDIVDTDTMSNTTYKDGEQPGKYASMSSNQTISKREKMKTILNNTNLMCYWIIKSSASGENLLFEPGSDEKILGDNDYFIYADESLNEIIILGAGTKLEKDPRDGRDWLIDSNNYSIDSISNNGTNSNIPWRNMNFNNYNLTIIEMTVISLGSGDKLTISDWAFATDGIDANSAVYINNAWKYCTANITYTVNNESITLPRIPNYYLIRSRLDLAASTDYPQTLYENQTVTVTTSMGDIVISGSDTKDDKYRKLQCSAPLSVVGGDYVDLSVYKMNNVILSIYSYLIGVVEPVKKKSGGWDKFNKKVIYIPVDTGVPEHVFPFWFRNKNDKMYPESPDAYIIPIYVENEALEVCVYVSGSYTSAGRTYIGPNTYIDSDNVVHSGSASPEYFTENYLVEMEDFNGPELVSANNDPNEPGHYKYLLTGSKKYYLVLKSLHSTSGSGMSSGKIIDDEELFLHVRWSPKYPDGFTSINPSCVVVDEPIVANGLNKKLSTSIDTKFANNTLLNRIKAIIDGSDNPNIKPNYTYEPDASMEIDLNKYLLIDAITGEYSSLAFDNPLILFDNNNVAHDMSIAEIDIANSNIDIVRDMRNY